MFIHSQDSYIKKLSSIVQYNVLKSLGMYERTSIAIIKNLPCCHMLGVLGTTGSLCLSGIFIFSYLGGAFRSRSGKYLNFLPADCEKRIQVGFRRFKDRDLIRGSISNTCLKRTAAAIIVLKD